MKDNMNKAADVPRSSTIKTFGGGLSFQKDIKSKPNQVSSCSDELSNRMSNTSACTNEEGKQDHYNIRKLNREDVLCGRGAIYASYPGNEQFYSLTESYRTVYERSRFKQEKRLIASTIVDKIRKSGGRFLKKNATKKAKKQKTTKSSSDKSENADESWHDIGIEAAINKTMHRLRDDKKAALLSSNHDGVDRSTDGCTGTKRKATTSSEAFTAGNTKNNRLSSPSSSGDVDSSGVSINDGASKLHKQSVLGGTLENVQRRIQNPYTQAQFSMNMTYDYGGTTMTSILPSIMALPHYQRQITPSPPPTPVHCGSNLFVAASPNGVEAYDKYNNDPIGKSFLSEQCSATQSFGIFCHSNLHEEAAASCNDANYNALLEAPRPSQVMSSSCENGNSFETSSTATEDDWEIPGLEHQLNCMSFESVLSEDIDYETHMTELSIPTLYDRPSDANHYYYYKQESAAIAEPSPIEEMHAVKVQKQEEDKPWEKETLKDLAVEQHGSSWLLPQAVVTNNSCHQDVNNVGELRSWEQGLDWPPFESAVGADYSTSRQSSAFALSDTTTAAAGNNTTLSSQIEQEIDMFVHNKTKDFEHYWKKDTSKKNRSSIKHKRRQKLARAA